MADVVGKIVEDVQEMWMVVEAEGDMASLRRLVSRPLHEALGTGLASTYTGYGTGSKWGKCPWSYTWSSRSRIEWG